MSRVKCSDEVTDCFSGRTPQTHASTKCPAGDNMLVVVASAEEKSSGWDH